MVQLNKEHAEEVGKCTNEKLKLAGMIGAATLTVGSLIALTSDLAASAIGYGLGALAPTLGLVPAVGVGGIAAVATATGSIAPSDAVAASFGVYFPRDWLKFNLLNFKELRMLVQLNLWRDTVHIFGRQSKS